MKTLFFKIAISVATVLLAIGGSFAIHASEKKAQRVLVGYATSLNGTPCVVTTLCGEIPNTVCIAILSGGIGSQAWGKFNPNDISCPIIFRQRPM